MESASVKPPMSFEESLEAKAPKCIVKKCTVRTPITTKKYNVMAFNARDKVNASTWTQAHMERDKSNFPMFAEYREERIRKKEVIRDPNFKEEEQPWFLRVDGKDDKRFKGEYQGGAKDYASYYLFKPDGKQSFTAFPVSQWYNFRNCPKYRTLTAEEAEKRWSRRNKVLNHFHIMIQHRLGKEENKEEVDGQSKKKKKKEKKNEKKKEIEKGKKGRVKANEYTEVLDDKDDGDNEGLEVDYMTDGSSSEEEVEPHKPNKGEEGPKGVDEASGGEEDEASEEEEGEPSEEEEEKQSEEEQEEEGTCPRPLKRKREMESCSPDENSNDFDNMMNPHLLKKICTSPHSCSSVGSPASTASTSSVGSHRSDRLDEMSPSSKKPKQ